MSVWVVGPLLIASHLFFKGNEKAGDTFVPY